MSTRSNIGIVNKDGSVRACYIHCDGYPEGVGADLLKDFGTPKKIHARLDSGSGSSLYDGFYKDRGESDVDAVTFPSVEAYLLEKVFGWLEYQYLYKDRKWWVYKVVDEDKPSVLMGEVRKVIAQEKKKNPA